MVMISIDLSDRLTPAHKTMVRSLERRYAHAIGCHLGNEWAWTYSSVRQWYVEVQKYDMHASALGCGRRLATSVLLRALENILAGRP
jgi:hypothetical protein